MIGIKADFSDQFRGGWQPTTISVIIVFIEVIGNILNQAAGHLCIISMEDDGAGGSLTRWVGKEPLMEHGKRSGGSHAGCAVAV